MNHSSFNRIYEIDRMIRQGRFSSAQEAARHFEVTRRTIERDLEQLRYSLNAEVAYDRKRRRYAYVGDPVTLPAMWLTEREIAILLIAERSLRACVGASFADEVHPAFNKLLEPIRHDRHTMDFVRDMCARIHFHRPYESAVDVREAFSRVLEAIMQRRRLAFEYRSAHERAAARRELEPYALVNSGGDWYVTGMCRAARAVRTFNLAAVAKAEIVDAAYEIPADFDAVKHFGRGFGRMHGEGDERVVLRVTYPAAQWIGRYIWHQSQTTRRRGDGIEIAMTCPVTDSLVRWVLQMGECVAVDKPESLRRAVVEKATAMAKNNRGPAGAGLIRIKPPRETKDRSPSAPSPAGSRGKA
jgi:predicted DNA-binding transcriptional regulator YafY